MFCGAVGRQAQRPAPRPAGPGPRPAGPADGQGAQPHLGPGGQPGVAEPVRQVCASRRWRMARRSGRAPSRSYRRRDGQRRPERLVLAAELLQPGRRLPQCTVEVADDRRGPRHGQLGHRVQVGIVDSASSGPRLLAWLPAPPRRRPPRWRSPRAAHTARRGPAGRASRRRAGAGDPGAGLAQMSSRRNQNDHRTRNRWGSGARSWPRYQRTAAARLPASACSRSSHSALSGPRRGRSACSASAR